MVLKLIIEISLVIFLILMLLLLIALRKYIKLLNKEIAEMTENTKVLAELESMNLELLKYLWDFLGTIRVQEVHNDEEGCHEKEE